MQGIYFFNPISDIKDLVDLVDEFGSDSCGWE